NWVEGDHHVPEQILPANRRVSGWSAFPVQAHVRWGTAPGEFDKMPAALVVGGKASRPAELLNRFSVRNGQELRIGHNFLNTVYEPIFQGCSVKVADTHDIVCTPQAIAQFMLASVAQCAIPGRGGTASKGERSQKLLYPIAVLYILLTNAAVKYTLVQ